MKMFLALTTFAAIVAGASAASANSMDANARMMHKPHHHMMMKKKMMHHGMAKGGMMKKDGMGDGMKKM
jgi:hypothetical protein